MFDINEIYIYIYIYIRSLRKKYHTQCISWLLPHNYFTIQYKGTWICCAYKMDMISELYLQGKKVCEILGTYFFFFIQIEEKPRDEWSTNLHRTHHFYSKLVLQTMTNKWVWGFFLIYIEGQLENIDRIMIIMRGNEKVWIGKAWIEKTISTYDKV